MTLKYIIVCISLLTLAWWACSPRIQQAKGSSESAGWVTGDFHEHSLFSDGGYPMDSVFDRGAGYYNVNLMLNTDHGGRYPRDYDGRTWDQIPGVVFKGSNAGMDKEGKQQMWRWQELLEYSYPRLAAVRQRLPGRHIIQGLEWNSPGTSHTTVGIVANDGLPIASFEYQFDQSDIDTSAGPAPGLIKQNGKENGYGKSIDKRAATTAAIEWLMKNHRYSSWAYVAHPERGGNVSIGDLRSFNNAGPDVAFGFEGVPGHQKNTVRAIFLSKNAVAGGTFGGVGYYAAQVGGVWDAMLGEGRHFWLVVSSDFHGMQSDFWPGEYHRTWIYAKDTTNALSIVDAMRSGNMFVCNGGLINALDIKAIQSGKSATLGETLTIQKGVPLEIIIRFRTDRPNYNNVLPEVKAIQLITGDITGMIKPGTPQFEQGTHPSAKVEQQFVQGEWKTIDGWSEIHYAVASPQKDFYFRVRGTNHMPGTPYETDASGNPLADSLATKFLNIDGAAEAWADLWFYANPVFIHVQ